MANTNHSNNNRKGQSSHHNHNPRFRNNRNRHRENYEGREECGDVELRETKEHRERKEFRENREYRENKEHRERREYRENREHRENRESRNSRDNQVINTFTLGMKELESKNAEFRYDKGWYSIIDIIGEEKDVIYKSKNAQEAYIKWNVYIGRKKERASRVEKTE